MDRNTFALLLKKYLSGSTTENEKLVVEQWYALLNEEPRELQPEEWDILEKRLWKKLQSSAGLYQEADKIRIQTIRRSRYISYAVAACGALLIIASYFLFFSNKNQDDLSENRKGYKLIVNSGNSSKEITLEDGTHVVLSPNARIQFPTHFELHQREVTLLGEAFFKVTENPNRPFLVNAGQITTKVLGTSFIVKAPKQNSNVEVEVKSGKVSVYEQSKPDHSQKSKTGSGVILNPNHKVTFIADNKMFVTKIVDNPEPLTPKAQKSAQSLDFDDKPIHEVLSMLESLYQVDLEVDKHSLEQCPITVNLTGKSLYPQLDLICAVIQGSYEIKGTSILISGQGCE